MAMKVVKENMLFEMSMRRETKYLITLTKSMPVSLRDNC
jgi:hypothetical protein